MFLVIQAGIFFQWVVGINTIWCVEHEEGERAVVDSSFEPPISDFSLRLITQVFKLLLMLCQVVNCVINVAKLVNQVVRDLGEVFECLQVILPGLRELIQTRIAGEGNRVNRGKDVFKGVSSIGKRLLSGLFDICPKLFGLIDDTGDVRLADLGVGGYITEGCIHVS